MKESYLFATKLPRNTQEEYLAFKWMKNRHCR